MYMSGDKVNHKYFTKLWSPMLILHCIVFILSIFSAAADSGFIRYSEVKGKPYSIAYDERSFKINGDRTLLLSGTVHYPRIVPEMWKSVLQEAVKDGLNLVQTYVFWNLHEPQRGQEYNFEGRANLTRFIEVAASVGLFVNLRIGPFVAAEWSYGGLPAWINQVPGIELRSNNSVWEMEMGRFVRDITTIVKPFLARNGGPVILAQIENEYRWEDSAYVKWCGELVQSLSLDIPWMMCNGHSASNTINTFNGNDGAKYAEEHHGSFPGQPLAWTEDEGWFQSWSKVPMTTRDNRPPEEMAYVILKWFARGACHHNYYMWYGGCNFGREGGNAITQMYANGVNFHSDFQPNLPKQAHLQKMYHLLAVLGDTLLSSPSQVNNSVQLPYYNNETKKFENGTKQFAYIYQFNSNKVTFLENDAVKDITVLYNGHTFYLPKQSVSLLDKSDTVLFNSGILEGHQNYTRTYQATKVLDQAKWQSWYDPMNFTEVVKARYPLEQLSLTLDTTDYLYYITELDWEEKAEQVEITIGTQNGMGFLVFVDGLYQCEIDDHVHFWNPTLNVSGNITLSPGKHSLIFLSVAMGMITRVTPTIFNFRGITSGVFLDRYNITEGTWFHQVGLFGEKKQIYTPQGHATVQWEDAVPTGKPLTWYSAYFPKPALKDGLSLVLKLSSMSRGHVFLNGFDLGRYWSIQIDGVFVQQWYFVPTSLLNDDNLLVLLDEYGSGNPKEIDLYYTQVVPA